MTLQTSKYVPKLFPLYYRESLPIILGWCKFFKILASFSSLLAISPLVCPLFSFLMAQGDRTAPLRGERSYKSTLTPETDLLTKNIDIEF